MRGREPGVAGILVALAVVAAGGQRPEFRAGVDLVNVGVMVTDRQGNFITDLGLEDFEIREEGRAQQVRYFARGGDEVENLHLGLLYDASGSMTRDISFARTAAIKFLNALAEARDITLVDFDTEVRVARYNQADFPRLVERIRQRRPDGWTALYDALGIYLAGIEGLDGRKVLVIYTDGGDTRSAVTFAEALDMLRTSDVTVYGIGFLEHQSSSVRTSQKMILAQLAEVTGGQAFFPTSPQTLDALYEKVAGQIRAQYYLGFTSTNERRDGAWRKLEVRLNKPHLQSLKVRSRKGYFAPMTPLGTADRRSGR